MNYPDNLISKESEDRLLWIYKTLKPEEKTGDWPPFNVYDMVQGGYPYPDHGTMVARDFGGTDKEGKVLPPKGMWCKVEDAMAKIDALEDILRRIACDLSVGGYNSPTVDPIAFYDKISWGIDEFAKSYHQLQLDLAEKRFKEQCAAITADALSDD
jgi:hypothetical protein